MLKGAEDSDRIAEFYEYIQDGEVKEAFSLLVGTFTCLKDVSCRVTSQIVRSIAVDLDGSWCFSIMPSREKLLFQWRPPVIKMKKYKKEKLKAQFPNNFNDDSHKDGDEHWAITVKSLGDALLLLLVLGLN
jgi:phosphatidylserine/phosphatidylglycerophosphate/cardiolipin synthase-like enzyme